MMDLRRIAIIFVIAVLYAVFVNAFIGAVYEHPKYEDFCKSRFYPEKTRLAPAEQTQIACPSYDEPSQEELNNCADDNGYPEYAYDGNGCVKEYTGCNYCQREFNDANEKFNFYYFIFSSILAVIGIGVGLWLPQKQSLNEWIATGFMLGGLFALFFGTIRFYDDLGKFIKPAVILAELVLVIFLSYMKLKDKPTNAENK